MSPKRVRYSKVPLYMVTDIDGHTKVPQCLWRNQGWVEVSHSAVYYYSFSLIGSEPGYDFTSQWWNKVFNSAAKNIQVKEENNVISSRVSTLSYLRTNKMKSWLHFMWPH